MMIISRFLRQSRAKLSDMLNKSLSLPCPEVFHFVIGNEACDLDSAISAIVYAWFLTQVNSGAPQTHYFPVLNILESMFRLRTETSFLLAKYGVKQEDIVFRDSIDFRQLLTPNHKDISITLVDHHTLPKSENYMLPHVVEIIDHRPQAGNFDPEIKVEIAMVGSCITLVAERIITAINEERLILDHDEELEIKSLIAGPIMLDTVGLSPAAGKVTERDLDVIRNLWGEDNNPDLHRLYQELKTAKYSAKGLTAKDLMLKDPKFIESSSGTKVMFSTLHDTLKNFLKREDAPECIPCMTEAEKFSLWVAIAPSERDETGKLFKPILLHSSDRQLQQKTYQSLLVAENPSLEISRSELIENLGENYVFLRMYNMKASRKQVLPVVQAII